MTGQAGRSKANSSSSSNSAGNFGRSGQRATPAPQGSQSNSDKVFFPPETPSKTEKFVHPASVINTPGAKRKADSPAGGRKKRPALTSDNGTPDDTTLSRDNGKLVIMIAQNVWSTLMTIGNKMAETRTIFDMPVAFSMQDSPTTTEKGLRLSDKARAEMVKMHQSIMFGTLIQYGLHGCRVQQQPTFEPGEHYSPTHVFPSGSEKAIYITPKASPAMPVADSQHPVATTTPPTPTQPNRATTRKGTGAAKPRAKKGSVASVCIPNVQRGEDGVSLNLETGIHVPISGLSKNQQKKLARQAKREPLNDNGAFAAAMETRDFATARKQLDEYEESIPKATSSAPATSGKTALRIPPPKPPKQLRQCKKIKDALEEGERRAANGEVRLPPTRGRSQSIAANSGQSNTSPAPHPFATNTGKSNSSPAQPTFATNAGNANTSPVSYAPGSSPPSSVHRGGQPIQQAQQPTVTFPFHNSAPPQGNQGFQYNDQLHAQQQQEIVQPIDPQLFGFDGQAQQPGQWTSGLQFGTQPTDGGQSHQPSGSSEQVNADEVTVQKENQQPAPASMDELLKASGMSMSCGQQGQVLCQGQHQQAASSLLAGNVDGIEIQPTNDNGQQGQGQVLNQEQAHHAVPTTITGHVDGVGVLPMDDAVSGQNNQAQPQVDASSSGTNVAPNKIIESNNEVQTNGYGMQPLAAVMPPGTAPKVVFAESTNDNVPDGHAQPQVEQDDQSFMADLFGEDFAEVLSQDVGQDSMAGLTEADLVAVRMQQFEQENAQDAAGLALVDSFNKYGSSNAMPQLDGTASPILPDNNNPANFYRDPSASKPSSVLAGAAAHAQQVYQSNIARHGYGQAAVPTRNDHPSIAPSNPQAAATPEQIAAHEAYKTYQLHAVRDLAALRARDNRRNTYLAANRDLPSQAEREKRARRKKAHECIAELRYVTAEARVFPPGHSQRVWYEESIEEMGRLEGEIKAMGDKVLADREYVVVRRDGYKCEEHWIPEEM